MRPPHAAGAESRPPCARVVRQGRQGMRRASRCAGCARLPRHCPTRASGHTAARTVPSTANEQSVLPPKRKKSVGMHIGNRCWRRSGSDSHPDLLCLFDARASAHEVAAGGGAHRRRQVPDAQSDPRSFDVACEQLACRVHVLQKQPVVLAIRPQVVLPELPELEHLFPKHPNFVGPRLYLGGEKRVQCLLPSLPLVPLGLELARELAEVRSLDHLQVVDLRRQLDRIRDLLPQHLQGSRAQRGLGGEG
mmetsp:Transcript_46225/g.130155  ORF Transcript_46225/g.130155 Transcript_46225/m.130155 type:complete len:249 (+) Transcript_46225:101-847(+)